MTNAGIVVGESNINGNTTSIAAAGLSCLASPWFALPAAYLTQVQHDHTQVDRYGVVHHVLKRAQGESVSKKYTLDEISLCGALQMV